MNPEWIAQIQWDSWASVYYISVFDKETKMVRHPKFPFPAESRDRKKAVKKAEAMLARAKNG